MLTFLSPSIFFAYVSNERWNRLAKSIGVITQNPMNLVVRDWLVLTGQSKVRLKHLAMCARVNN
jgi:hypothetical protein